MTVLRYCNTDFAFESTKKTRMIRIRWLFLLIFTSTFFAHAQVHTSFADAENELETLLNSLRDASNDLEKKERNEAFRAKMEEVLSREGSLSYPFSRLTTVGFIPSPGKLVRVVNWNVEQDDKTQKYFCFIQRYDEKKKELQLNEFTKGNYVMPLRPTEILQSNQWYGALYYQIIPFEKGNRDMYVLLGWDGLGTASNMKMIDVLYFSGTSAKLGSPVFKVGSETFKRVFYEHSEKTTMSLRYDEKHDRILFDHLSPESNNLVGHYSYYVPDLSYDAFELKNGKWYLKEDVIAVNGKTSEKIEVIPVDKNGEIKYDKNGEPIKKRIKNKWENPSNPNAPAGGNNHEVALPEVNPNKEVKKEKPTKEKKKWLQKKDKRDASNQYPYSDWKKPKPKRKKR